MMNVREGMRRLGLGAGIFGAVAGGFISYTVLPPILEQRNLHKRFRSLVSSPAVVEYAEWLYRQEGAFALMTIHPDPELATMRTDEFNGHCGPNGDGWWRIDEGGIKKVYFSGGTKPGLKPCHDLSQVTAIETDDGWAGQIDPVGVRAYLLVLGFPVAGFLLPWGILKALYWIAIWFAPTSRAG